MLSDIKSNFNSKTWIFIIVAVAIDLLLFPMAIIYPIVGMFLVSILCGPWAGALTGVISQVIFSVFLFFIFPESRDSSVSPFFPWWLLSFFMGYFAGKMSQWEYFKSWWLAILTGFLTAVITNVLYITINGLFFTNNPNFLEIINKFLNTAINGFTSFYTSFPALPITIAALVAFFLIKSPLSKFFIGLPQMDNISSQTGTSTPKQKTLGLVVLGIVIFWIIFVILIATALS